MTVRRFALVSMVLAALLLSSCGARDAGLTTGQEAASPQPATGVFPDYGDFEPTGPRPAEPPPPAREGFAGSEMLSQGQNLRYESSEPLFQVITTQQELSSFWLAYLPGIPLPEVDFQSSFVLAGIQGVKSTGGYSIAFTGLQQQGDVVRVITELTEPAASESVDMTFTQPYTVLRVDSTALPSRGALVFVFETEAGTELGRVPVTVP